MAESQAPLTGANPAIPSEVLGPEALDQALLLIVVREDGSTFATASSLLNRPAAVEWLTRLCDTLSTLGDDCEACAAGTPHTHEDGVPSPS